MFTRGMAIILTTMVMMCAVPAQKVEASDMKIPASAREYKGHFYKVYRREGTTWDKANQLCQSLGGI